MRQGLALLFWVIGILGAQQASTAISQANTYCRNDMPNDGICLAVKYVAFVDHSGQPILSEQQAQKNIQGINQIWKQCNIGFKLDEFVPIKPAEFKLRYQIANYKELTDIRNAFADDRSLLVVHTGTWDRSGSLGTTGANAWTAMPGSGPYGAVLERPVSTNSNLIAHELGHYLNLFHISDDLSIMNSVIYQRSTSITDSQCKTARSAALSFWQKALR
jgi:hypothetical protein